MQQSGWLSRELYLVKKCQSQGTILYNSVYITA
jgi:hypothetical protein